LIRHEPNGLWAVEAMDAFHYVDDKDIFGTDLLHFEFSRTSEK